MPPMMARCVLTVVQGWLLTPLAPKSTPRRPVMVTLAGQPQGWPVPFIAGSANPVNVTALIDICTSSGDSLNQIKEAVYHG
ncbi:ash family protein [Salmonella enterica]|nr:ash family protein [Salmonella enterica]